MGAQGLFVHHWRAIKRMGRGPCVVWGAGGEIPGEEGQIQKSQAKAAEKKTPWGPRGLMPEGEWQWSPAKEAPARCSDR